MDLRDPIWQGIAAIIAILTFFGAIATKIFPDFKAALEKLYKGITESVSCLIAIIVSCIICLCLLLSSPTINLVSSILATSTPTPTLTPIPTPIPTATPIPPPSYTNLLYDNFDNGPLPSWSPVSGTWQMVNNQYTVTNVLSETDWASGTNFIGDPTWTNYQLGTNVHLENIEPKINIAYIIVRAQDENNFLALELRDFDLFDSDWSRGTWYIVQNKNWTEKPAASFSSPMVTNFSVEIQVQQDIITTFIDGVQVSRWGEAPYLNGMVGIGVSSRYPTHPTSFDNIYVRTQP